MALLPQSRDGRTALLIVVGAAVTTVTLWAGFFSLTGWLVDSGDRAAPRAQSDFFAKAVDTAADTDQSATDYPTAAELEAAAVREPLVRQLLHLAGDEESQLVHTIDGKPNGYASLVIGAPLSNEVTLRWKGELPPSVRTFIAEHPEVTVHLVDAPHSLVEMSNARDKVTRELDARLGAAGSLLAVGPDKFGTGIWVMIKTDDPELTEAAARETLAAITSIPVVELELTETGVTLY
ncbi:hypothetical protein [Microbacterium terricola]|uniref:Uncharacterized protein n=1 Tax=Microbacterium terricola TaxID=344163 RepID=A0ABM8E2W7_9MICO|nr:hypothetical protein [Microbacterium terricola]UYK39994.1 hypothetical protein OAU46_15100 [Microbacterium terricola]BDV32317.1 hypothetical protein Microterr_29770 [Microbacterium terricola]